jgi:hypothetical protein
MRTSNSRVLPEERNGFGSRTNHLSHLARTRVLAVAMRTALTTVAPHVEVVAVCPKHAVAAIQRVVSVDEVEASRRRT